MKNNTKIKGLFKVTRIKRNRGEIIFFLLCKSDNRFYKTKSLLKDNSLLYESFDKRKFFEMILKPLSFSNTDIYQLLKINKKENL